MSSTLRSVSEDFFLLNCSCSQFTAPYDRWYCQFIVSYYEYNTVIVTEVSKPHYRYKEHGLSVLLQRPATSTELRICSQINCLHYMR
jgi:hypothetical protein